jgi:tetratricopeptide (TPR) repeat protein
MRWARAFAGVSRTESSPVDETAITLKLTPLRPRHRWLARWPTATAATAAVLTVAAFLVVDAPDVEPVERAAAPSPRAVESSTRGDGPILAATTLPPLESADAAVDIDEIVILDEPVVPPQANTRAARRARARTMARTHVSAGEAARRIGDLATARDEFEAALKALPSYGPAAAALAEVHMKQGSYRSALVYAKRAARSAPRKLDYMVLLGDAYANTNHRAAAQKLWRRAEAYGSLEARSRLAG